jgi:shikimate kinase
MGVRLRHPPLAKNLVLIGGRGCGKSSIAKRLARANRHFMLFSLDALVRYEAQGATIAEIVAREGWPGFRARELAVVNRAAAFRGGALIDAGGGVVAELSATGDEIYSKAKVDALRRHGRLVYLQRDLDYLERRIAEDAARPTLSARESFREIMARRDPWYRRAAHHVIACGQRSKAELAKEILAWFYRDLGVAGR